MARGRMGGGGGGMDYSNMLKQAQKMQAEVAKAQSELEQTLFTAAAGGGVVNIALKGDNTMESIEIDPELLADGDVEMLQDMILAAYNDCLAQLNEKKEQIMGQATGGMRMPF